MKILKKLVPSIDRDVLLGELLKGDCDIRELEIFPVVEQRPFVSYADFKFYKFNAYETSEKRFSVDFDMGAQPSSFTVRSSEQKHEFTGERGLEPSGNAS